MKLRPQGISLFCFKSRTTLEPEAFGLFPQRAAGVGTYRDLLSISTGAHFICFRLCSVLF